mgnify:CR=1 FL=1
MERETVVNTDRPGFGCDRHDVIRIVLPVLRFAAAAIEMPLGIEVIEWSKPMTSPEHGHAAILRRGLIEIDKYGQQRRVAMGVERDVLMPPKLAGALRDRFGRELGMLELDVFPEQRLDGSDDARITGQIQKGGMAFREFEKMNRLMLDPFFC